MTQLPSDIVVDVQDAGLPRVLEAVLRAQSGSRAETLAVVLETEGSTYARAGTVVLFSEEGHIGWLSGGCLEPEIEQAARQAALSGRLGWMEIDTRDDAAMFSGNAVGCRGCQRVALIPLHALVDRGAVFTAWLDGDGPLQLSVDAAGGLVLRCAGRAIKATITADPLPFEAAQRAWPLRWMPPPRVLLLGAGPEAASLVPTLHGLGWRVRTIDPRENWRARCPVAVESVGVASALAQSTAPVDAVLVMQHNFELDLQALELLAASDVPFIGLLGPQRRREELFSLLPTSIHASLQHRLRSPIGLDLGGRGPEAIALSIAAELQAWRHGALPSRS